jgi:RNA polymerase sigma-32 factor
MLGWDEERELALRWQEHGDERALHRLIRSYARLVVKIANRYRKTGIPMDDLVQEGNVGLLEAAGRFDPAYDNRFATYASWWIISTIQYYIMRNVSVVRVMTTNNHKRIYFNLKRLRAQLVADPGSPLSEEDRTRIADELQVSPADVERIDLCLAASDSSLNTLVGNDNFSGAAIERQDTIADDSPSPEILAMELHEARNRATRLDQAMKNLTAREQAIIVHRFLKDEKATLDELGGAFGISKERIRQIESHALRKLQAAMLALVDDPKDLFRE